MRWNAFVQRGPASRAVTQLPPAATVPGRFRSRTMPRTTITVPLAGVLTTLLAAVLVRPAPAQDLSVPRSFYGFGDPTALAVNTAETRAYVGEGGAVSILDLSVLANPMPPSAVLARIPVDASVVALTLDEANQRLLV